MVTKKIRRTLLLVLLAVSAATAMIFVFLIRYNNRITQRTTAEIGSMYMSEMMYQMQDHFDTIITLKHKDAMHITHHPDATNEAHSREVLMTHAAEFGFDYLALYDDQGNYDRIMGETAWYRNLSGFIEKVKSGERVTTTGYLTSSGEKYLVFGTPVQYEMLSGETSSVALLGFNVKKLYQYIHIEKMEQFGHDTRMDIVLTNGSYVLSHGENANTSYFDHISRYGSFVRLGTEEGIASIEKAMAAGKEFTHTVTLDGMTKHVYGAPASTPEDWYFVLSMPQGITDELLNEQSLVSLKAFGVAGLCMFALFLGVFLFYLNMSLKQLQETEEARTEAEIANNAKSSFLSNMSHDIRTPMNAIAGFTSIAEDQIRQGNNLEALEAISKVKRSSEYLRSLIGDVLDMSKIESGKFSLMLEPVSLSETIDMIDTIAKIRSEMKRQNYTLVTHDLLHDSIECDQTRLNQVLINLIGNAVKFTDEGGSVQLEVWQEISDKGDEFVRTNFLVEDTGIGMSPEFLETIFESFSREENRVRKIEGTGLGLAISKRLIDMMEGCITVSSEESVGSQFLVTVDFRKAENPVEADAEHVSDISASGIRILLAEDNDFNYDIAQVLLGNYGFIMERAYDGEEAVKLYCAAPEAWDLILMDLRMPVLDGYQAAEQIRAFEAEQKDLRCIPIFALSADVFEEDIKRCMDVGMEGHISKPIDMNELLRKIKKYVKNS